MTTAALSGVGGEADGLRRLGVPTGIVPSEGVAENPKSLTSSRVTRRLGVQPSRLLGP